MWHEGSSVEEMASYLRQGHIYWAFSNEWFMWENQAHYVSSTTISQNILRKVTEYKPGSKVATRQLSSIVATQEAGSCLEFLPLLSQAWLPAAERNPFLL